MSLIVMEGLDGSGKGTQTALLYEKLKAKTQAIRRISFPNYDSPSSALVKMYLGGEFGSSPEDVNAYAASAFYAVDRYASYQMDWRADYEKGVLFLADRYATSNIVYQLVKLPQEQWKEYIRWMEDFEYGRLGIPRPDLVVYLDVPADVSQKLLSSRYHGDNSQKDIHERDFMFQQRCRACALYAAEVQGWKVIPCTSKGQMRPVEEISEEILRLVTEICPV